MEEQQKEQRQIITSLFNNYPSGLGSIKFRDKTLSPLLTQNQDKDVMNNGLSIRKIYIKILGLWPLDLYY